MKKTILMIGGLAMAFGGVAMADAPKDQGAGAMPKVSKEQQAGMERWQKSMTPGEQHKLLAKSVGKWDATVKMFMTPGAPAQEAKGSAEFAAVLDGRFVRQDFSGSMMGQPFHGVGYDGYDNFKGQFVSTWMDDMSTSIMVTYGTPDKDGKSITMTGTMDEPMTGEKNKKVKQVLRMVDDNNMVFEMYDSAKGKEWKALEIDYTRAK